MKISITDLAIIVGIIISTGSILNAILFAYLRTIFVSKRFLFCSKNGTPIYRTIDDCKDMEETMKKERREEGKRIETRLQEKVEAMEKGQKQFTENLMNLFAIQTQQITKAVTDAVRQ